jgi:hypothetical protein
MNKTVIRRAFVAVSVLTAAALAGVVYYGAARSTGPVGGEGEARREQAGAAEASGHLRGLRVLDEPWRSDVLESLARLRTMYASTAARLSWTVSIEDLPGIAPPGAAVQGQVHARWDGDRSFIALHLDPALELSAPLETAFDGATFEVFDPQASLLIRTPSGAKPRHSPMGLPNPAMLAWDFLSEHADTCDGCSLRPGDLADPQVWEGRLDQMHLVDLSPDQQTVVIRVPGGVLDGLSFEHWVTLEGPPGLRHPTRIQRVADTGTVLTDLTISSYRPVAASSLEIADVIRLELLGGTTITYTLTAAEAPPPGSLGAEEFRIDPARAARVLNAQP